MGSYFNPYDMSNDPYNWAPVDALQSNDFDNLRLFDENYGGDDDNDSDDIEFEDFKAETADLPDADETPHQAADRGGAVMEAEESWLSQNQYAQKNGVVDYANLTVINFNYIQYIVVVSCKRDNPVAPGTVRDCPSHVFSYGGTGRRTGFSFVMVPLGNAIFDDHRAKHEIMNILPKPTNFLSSREVPQNMRSLYEIPEAYRQIFSNYQCLNSIQSAVFEDLIYTDRSIVVSAPTGSGKTALFELAIVRLLQNKQQGKYHGDFKIVYMAPVKALCSERLQDWTYKFSSLGLSCIEVTGDSDTTDFFELREFQVILTTPEKWDSLTRRWRDHKGLVRLFKLFLIDEVHLLSEERRGPTMEAVVSRMKTVQRVLKTEVPHQEHHVRFVAVSATIPNIEDLASWLSDTVEEKPAIFHKFSDHERPVPLRKIVLGYPCQESWSPFRFDLSLTYKLQKIILKYADGKPTLIFCSTRKAVQQTMGVLVKNITFTNNLQNEQLLNYKAANIKDVKIREDVLRCVGCHHAGMSSEDRHIVEELFRSGVLAVLVATSTLAMGVNLPAHLVIIKSTEQYAGGEYREYSESQLLQMMGRAGRPQYDSKATAIIMTRNSHRARYAKLVEGRQLVESTLHRHLPEHLNAEVVLKTISDLGVAMDWVRSTFLYVRALKCPREYGVAGYQDPKDKQQDLEHLTEAGRLKVEARLHELCMRELNALSSCELVELDGMDVSPTEAGRLMARYYLALDTMKIFMQLTGEENLPEMLAAISRCAEFSEVQLRMNERRALNQLNKRSAAQGGGGVRFPLTGRVKSRDMKVNVLVQATLGAMPIQDPGLNQEGAKIFRVGRRVTKCLSELVTMKLSRSYKAALVSLLLIQAFHVRLWHDSTLVSRQLPRIGPALASLLAAAGKTSFAAILKANPRDLERIVNRGPPLGNTLQELVSRLPQYELRLEVWRDPRLPRLVHVTLSAALSNAAMVAQENTAGEKHGVIILLGERNSNTLLFRERISDSYLMRCTTYSHETKFWQQHEGDDVKVKDDAGLTLQLDPSTKLDVVAHLISETWDVERVITVPALEEPHPVVPHPSVSTPGAKNKPRVPITTPRSIKHYFQQFAKKREMKSIAGVGKTEPGSTLSSSTSGELNKDGQQPAPPPKNSQEPALPASTSTPATALPPTPRPSVTDRIRAKYGQLHLATGPKPTRLTFAAVLDDRAIIEKSEGAAGADQANDAELPTPSITLHPSQPSNDNQVTVNQQKSTEGHSNPSYSPLTSCHDLEESSDDEILEVVQLSRPQQDDITSAKCTNGEVTDQPEFKLPILTFDLGIEELLADDNSTPEPVPMKSVVKPSSEFRMPTQPRKRYHLSPPRDPEKRYFLIQTVLGGGPSPQGRSSSREPPKRTRTGQLASTPVLQPSSFNS